MSWDFFFNNGKDVEATIYRGTAKVYGPIKKVDVQNLTFVVKPENFYTNASTQNKGGDLITHKIFLELPNYAQYTPMLEDRIHIEGSHNGALDGDYVVKQYAHASLGFSDSFAYLELDVRQLSVKKPGDTNLNDNSGNIRLGGRTTNVREG